MTPAPDFTEAVGLVRGLVAEYLASELWPRSGVLFDPKGKIKNAKRAIAGSANNAYSRGTGYREVAVRDPQTGRVVQYTRERIADVLPPIMTDNELSWAANFDLERTQVFDHLQNVELQMNYQLARAASLRNVMEKTLERANGVGLWPKEPSLRGPLTMARDVRFYPDCTYAFRADNADLLVRAVFRWCPPEMDSGVAMLNETLVNLGHACGEHSARIVPLAQAYEYLVQRWREVGLETPLSHDTIKNWYCDERKYSHDHSFGSDPVKKFLDRYACKDGKPMSRGLWSLREAARERFASVGRPSAPKRRKRA